MPPKDWRRVALAILPIVLCLGIAQLDRSAATLRAARVESLAVQLPAASGTGPIVGPAVAPYRLPARLHDLAAALPPAKARAESPRALPLPKASVAAPLGDVVSDPIVQSQAGPASMPAPSTNFDGLNNVDNLLPPDSNGDISPNHYFQVVNTSFMIFDRNGTPLLSQPTPNNIFWSSLQSGDPCKETNSGSAVVLYDHLASRWLFSQPAWPNGGPYHQCFAISLTSDPLGDYWVYSFELSSTELNDYPKLGVWPDGYYMSVNQFDANGWSGPAVYVFEREKMLNQDYTRWISWDYDKNSPFGGMLPSDLDGPPPPAGTPNYFVEVDKAGSVFPDDSLLLWRFHVDWSNLNNSTFGNRGNPNAILRTAPFNLLPCITGPAANRRNCIPQKDTSQKLESLGDRLMHRLQFRHFGDHDSLVTNHTVDAGGGRAGVRWYELRNPQGAPTIYQQGTYAPGGGEHRWMGSTAMDRQGNIAIGYSVSSSSSFPSINYAGRLVSDSPGLLAQGEATLKAGGGSQLSTFARWGGYTMMAVDPTDDCTFWYTNEYLPNTGIAPWQTRVGAFRFSTCTGASTGHLAGIVTRVSTGARIPNATVRAGTRTTTTDVSGVYQFFNLPVGTYSLSASAPGYATKTINGVVVSDRRTTTQNVALQVAAAPTGGKGYLPLVQRPLPPTPTPTPTPITKCDSFEPNDNRATNPAGPLLSGQTYQAKFCAGDPEDNYFFTTATGNQIQISITLPPALVNHTLLWVYDQDDLRQGQEVCKHGFITKSPLTVLCSIQNPGTYVLRLYTDSDAVFDNVNPYTFHVDFQ